MIRKIALLGSTAALLAGSLMVGGVAHAGAPPVNASGDTVSCATILKGTVGFKPSLTLAGSGPAVISIKGSLAGCTTNDANITSISGSFKGTLNSPTSSFTSLLGPSNATGTIVVTWKTVPALVTKTTTVTISAGNVVGGTNNPFADAATYGQFDISGAAVTGSFLGGDNGASSVTHALTTQDAGNLLATGSSATGIKAINLGLGEINFG